MNFASKLIDPILQSFQYVTGNLRVLTITDLLGNFSRRLVFPYASLYILALGGSATQIGLIAFLSQVAGLFLLLAWVEVFSLGANLPQVDKVEQFTIQ